MTGTTPDTPTSSALRFTMNTKTSKSNPISLPAHKSMLEHVDADFSRLDRLLSVSDKKVFNNDSEMMFKQLDDIRKRQISLAIQHAKMNDENNEVGEMNDEGGLANKQANLNNLMNQLQDLSNSLAKFHDLSNSSKTEAEA